MEQTKLASLYEAVINVVIGLVINLMAQMIIFPFWGFHPSFGTNLGIAMMFTPISVLRGYVIRRWCNEKIRNAAEIMALHTGIFFWLQLKTSQTKRWLLKTLEGRWWS